MVAPLTAGLILAGCGEQPIAPPAETQDAKPRLPGPRQAVRAARSLVADFALPDVNPNSATMGETLGPRIYLHQVSAWYFGHAT